MPNPPSTSAQRSEQQLRDFLRGLPGEANLAEWLLGWRDAAIRTVRAETWETAIKIIRMLKRNGTYVDEDGYIVDQLRDAAFLASRSQGEVDA